MWVSSFLQTLPQPASLPQTRLLPCQAPTGSGAGSHSAVLSEEEDLSKTGTTWKWRYWGLARLIPLLYLCSGAGSLHGLAFPPPGTSSSLTPRKGVGTFAFSDHLRPEGRTIEKLQ